MTPFQYRRVRCELVIEGRADWVQHTLDNSYVKLGEPKNFGSAGKLEKTLIEDKIITPPEAPPDAG